MFREGEGEDQATPPADDQQAQSVEPDSEEAQPDGSAQGDQPEDKPQDGETSEKEAE